jgi:hypothetical protein
MSKPSKSRALYERNMDLQKAYAEVSALTEQRDKLAEGLRKIVSDGDYTAPEGMKRIAREVLHSCGLRGGENG